MVNTVVSNWLKRTIVTITICFCYFTIFGNTWVIAGQSCGQQVCKLTQVCMPKAGSSTEKECVEAKDTFSRVFTPMANILTGVAVISGFFLLVIAGYKIMTSQGNPQNLQEGKDMLGAVIPGLIFVLIASSILRVLIKVLISGGTTNPF